MPPQDLTISQLTRFCVTVLGRKVTQHWSEGPCAQNIRAHILNDNQEKRIYFQKVDIISNIEGNPLG